MKAHELAKKLLEGPDLPVVINGWSSDEGFSFEVTSADPASMSFYGKEGLSDLKPRNRLGYPVDEDCVMLNYG